MHHCGSLTPFVPLSLFFSLPLSCSSFFPLSNISPLTYFTCPLFSSNLSCPCRVYSPLPCLVLPCCSRSSPLTCSPSPPQRCRCHRCCVSPQSESCLFRSGSSTRRDLSWSPSTHLFIPAVHGTHTSSASSTGPCWSKRRQGTWTKGTCMSYPSLFNKPVLTGMIWGRWMRWFISGLIHTEVSS